MKVKSITMKIQTGKGVAGATGRWVGVWLISNKNQDATRKMFTVCFPCGLFCK